jgi:hypothetical protein
MQKNKNGTIQITYLKRIAYCKIDIIIIHIIEEPRIFF